MSTNFHRDQGSAAPSSPGYHPEQWAVHTPYSDPGRYADLLFAVRPAIEHLSAVARNLIIHYRSSGVELPEETRDDINARWLASILELDQQRHPQSLDGERVPTSKVQGCCRDHSLFSAAVLRQHGVPARIRYGFAHYFVQGYSVDHVIVETWLPKAKRWLRFDPGVGEPLDNLATPHDIPHGPDAPFTTAAECWRAYRAGTIDPQIYGVGPDAGVGGDWYLQGAVLYDAAFRAGIELLVWDTWPGMSSPDHVTEDEARRADDLSTLIIAADSGDVAAEDHLIDRMRSDPTVGPGVSVRTMSPRGDAPTITDLAAGAVPRR